MFSHFIDVMIKYFFYYDIIVDRSDNMFNTEQELYNRIYPALSSKVAEFCRKGTTYVREKDIYDWLKKTNWINRENLNLSDIVSDIMHVKEDDVKKFV